MPWPAHLAAVERESLIQTSTLRANSAHVDAVWATGPLAAPAGIYSDIRLTGFPVRSGRYCTVTKSAASSFPGKPCLTLLCLRAESTVQRSSPHSSAGPMPSFPAQALSLEAIDTNDYLPADLDFGFIVSIAICCITSATYSRVAA